ncbi:MAG TPA: azurin [Chitinophagaceae bacterium]|nr:azurin [Flavobacteriales bacterium]HMN33775.1 azurin [Chitinophagaceae bacterium]
MGVKKIFSSLLVTCSIAAVVSSCNSTSKDNQSDNNIENAEIEAKLSKQDTITIVLESNDKMQFDKTEIVVYDGQTVVLTLKHTGSMPKSAMGHNFVLINNTISVSDYANKAMKAKDNEYIPEDASLTLAHTKMIGGGDSTEIIFSAPKAGTYDFLCSFPGHYSIMKGKFFVK